jgi:hypothetical protein
MRKKETLVPRRFFRRVSGEHLLARFTEADVD